MIHLTALRRSPDTTDEASAYNPAASESLAQTKAEHSEGRPSPVTSSPGEAPYEGSHADNYAPAQAPERNVPEDGPSGENTRNEGENGGGLWTSGGTVTTGTPYHDKD